MLRPSGAAGVRRPDRSVSMRFEPQGVPRGELKDLERAAELAEELEEIVARMPEGSFTQDPGMRAGDEFTDVASPGYREGAKRVAERGGAKEYATSVEEEEADAKASTLRNRVGIALATLVAGGVMGMGANRALGPGPRPGLGLGSRNPSQAEWNAMKMRPGRDQAADMMRAKGIKPGYTSGGGFGVDAVSPYLAYRAIKGRGK